MTRRNKWKIAIAIISLLALLAIANYGFNMDPVQLAARGVGRSAHDHHHDHDKQAEEPPKPIRPIGPEDAPVVIEVFYSNPEMYHGNFEEVINNTASRFEGVVRIEPRDLTEHEARERCLKLPLRGHPGLAINGEVIVDAPGVGDFGLVNFTGSPFDRRWNEQMLHQVIEYELKRKNVDFTPPPALPQGEPGAQDGHEHHHH